MVLYWFVVVDVVDVVDVAVVVAVVAHCYSFFAVFRSVGVKPGTKAETNTPGGWNIKKKHIESTLLDEISADKTTKFCPPKYFVRRNL